MHVVGDETGNIGPPSSAVQCRDMDITKLAIRRRRRRRQRVVFEDRSVTPE